MIADLQQMFKFVYLVLEVCVLVFCLSFLDDLELGVIEVMQ